ncbi:MAG TPA: hypothetical protein VGA04_00050 [Streptosporangiaceae bacterium]
MSSVTQSGTRSSNKGLAVVLAILGVLAIVVAIIYWTVAAGSLPSILGHINGSTGHHALRAATSAVVGVILLGLAWWVGRSKSRSASSG